MALTSKQQEVLAYIKEFYEKNNFSPSMKEIAKHFEVTTSTVQGYLKELALKGAINKLPNQSRSIVIKGSDLPSNMTLPVPILGSISAGEGITVMEDENPERVNVPASWLNTANGMQYYCLRVSGFSMLEDGIFDNDLVVIRQQSSADNGDTVVAIRKDGDEEKATLKVFYDRGSKVELKPKNPFLPSIFLDKENVEIRGKFSGLIRQDSQN